MLTRSDSLFMEMLMETTPTSFIEFVEFYFNTWNLFAQILLTGSVLPLREERMSMQRAIPRHLQEEYRLLHLHAEVSLAEVRTQYRELAKRYHPDAGGSHDDFLALQQAYEQVVKYLQARSRN
jgi:DnaJ-class molecular chaperone